MKFWWYGDTARLGEEKQAVESVAATEPWFEFDRWCFHAGHLTAVGMIIVHGHRYPVRLQYPDQFPDVPAWVEPQEDVKWSSHQYGSGGSLCLELRPDNWESTATGADVLRSAYNLLRQDNDPSQDAEQRRVPSAHHTGELQAYDWASNPVLVSAGCLDRIKAGTAQDLKALRWMAYDDVWPIMMHDKADRTSARHAPGPDLNTWRFEIPIQVIDGSPPADNPDRYTLLIAAGADPSSIKPCAEAGAALVVFTGDAGLAAYHSIDDGAPHLRKLFVLPDQAEARSGRSADALARRVAIVGAGSVGSKIAECLLRSGISRQTIVDGDVMLPGNLERHALDWRDVGFRKVHGLRRHLLNISPGADITVIDQNLNWQRSARVHATHVAAIAECDLIIDASGDAATSLFLGAIAAANNLPFVSAEVYEGGIGALIASCLPERDPPYAKARAAYFAWCEQKNTAPPRPAARPYDGLADDGSVLVADDAAASMSASHAARVVLDILDGTPAGLEAAWMLIGFRKSWIFKGHGDTFLMSVGSPDGPTHAAEDADTRDFVLALAKEYLGENPSGT